jgi:large subunit ribosomal protein L35
VAKSAKRMKKLRAKVAPKCVKMKTKQSARKRYKISGTGKVKCPRAFRSHLTGDRPRSRKNRLRKGKMLCKSNIKLVRRCMPNSF